MTLDLVRGFFVAVTLSLLTQSAFADTIVNLTFTQNLDFELSGRELSTIDDGNAGSPGDQDTSIEFPMNSFVSGEPGIVDNFGSFTLSGVQLEGSAVIVSPNLLAYQTTGGTFELYDESNATLLTGTFDDGSFYASYGAGTAATGGWLNINLGTFTGPEGAPENSLFKLLDPNSAAMAISFTEIFTGAEPGVSVESGEVLDFTADATANIAAEAIGNTLTPEPAAGGMAVFALLGVLGFRRRR